MDWDNHLRLVKTGEFSLDPGAYFGIVPRAIWGRSFSATESGRIKLALNTAVINYKGNSYIIDTGIGQAFDGKLRQIYDVTMYGNTASLILDAVEKGADPLIVCSHLHFDHSGNCRMLRSKLRPHGNIIVQEEEWRAAGKLNEFTRGSYGDGRSGLRSDMVTTIRGTSKIRGLNVILTGGHSPGHQVVVFNPGHGEIIYFGDLIPSRFHVRPAYVTAIDVEPLVSLRMKKLLIKRAIRNGSLCIFNHDDVSPLGYLRGEPEKPVVEPFG
ncbi:MAG: MBL fold metallo-hydrolase [Thermoplasmataceae archaeon]